MRRHPHTPRHITANPDPPSHSQQRALTTSASTRRVVLVVGIRAPPPDIIAALETQQRNRTHRLDVRHRARILQHPHHTTVSVSPVPHERGVTDRGVIAAHDDGVLERDRDSGQRAREIDGAVRQPFLRRREEDLCQTVGAGVGAESDASIGLQDGKGGGGARLD